MQIKICGLREEENVLALAALHPQWMGFIFVPDSPRYFLDALQPIEIQSLPESIKRVGVFVNESIHKVAAIQKFYRLDYLQLHGDETVAECRLLQAYGKKVIKAFSIHEGFDFSTITDYEPYVELLLFDTAGKNKGGNGKRFNWNLLNGKRFSKPFLLSGGIGPDDVELLKSFHHPDMAGIDVNSRFEISPGVKDVQMLKSFMQQI